jgi:hypothetical protein
MIFSGTIYSIGDVYEDSNLRIFLEGYAYNCTTSRIHMIKESIKLSEYCYWGIEKETEVFDAFINYIWIDKQ